MNNFEKEFVPYTEALELKQLGFDEPCMASRDMNNKEGIIQIPLYQQAFRWFREKHSLPSHIRQSWSPEGEIVYVASINGGFVDHGNPDKPFNRFDTYEEAELACLRKLIQIVKEKQQ